MRLIIFFMIVSFLTACKENPTSSINNNIDNQNQQNSTKNDDQKGTPFKKTDPKIISDNSFMGISIGEKFKLHSDQLKEGFHKSGEGYLGGYHLLDDEENIIGFVFPDPVNEEIIGQIEISSADYRTKKGIGIGSTFEELKNKYPDIETHGSEIESRTSSQSGGLSFLLNAYFNTYYINDSHIKPSTIIKKISIIGTKK